MSDSLQELVSAIVAKDKKSDECVIEAAKLLCELHGRVRAGEAGTIEWHEWVRRNVPLKRSRIYVLLGIGAAEDPHAALKRHRDDNKHAQARYRNSRVLKSGDRSEAESDPAADRILAWTVDLQRWLRTASPQDIATLDRDIQAEGKRSRAGQVPILPASAFKVLPESRTAHGQ